MQDLANEKILQSALAKHAEAFNRAAAASDRYANRLVIATWALVVATFLLAMVEAIKFFQIN